MLSVLMIAAVAAATNVPDVQIRKEWAQQVNMLLPSVKPADRAAAYRNYADMLVDLDQCDAAIDVFAKDPSLDAEVIESTMAYAVSMSKLRCAARLGELAVSRATTSSTISPRRVAALRMAAGAAIRVGGADSQGASIIEEAEKSLETISPNAAPGTEDGNLLTLWKTRGEILQVYAGTPFYDPAMTTYGGELAAQLARSPLSVFTPVVNGFILRFAAAGRADLVSLVAAKLNPFDRRGVNDVVNMAQQPEFADTYGNHGGPHCSKPANGDSAMPLIPDARAPFATIAALSMRSAMAAKEAQCTTFDRHQ